MSRKFNTKKFIKDVLNDRYALFIGNQQEGGGRYPTKDYWEPTYR